ncbi:metallophosphoesterase [Candidatus Woesearchaeota archaeon]|nr:metallophosphoesterase [Candidatus Woesearchaeota archaeon]
MAAYIQIKQGFFLDDVALYIEPYKILAFGDVHIGYEEALNKQGVLVPRFQFEETMKRIKRIMENIPGEIETVVINGDLKHEFGTISNQEWKEALEFLDYIGGFCKEIVLVKGNHDTILGPIARKRNVKLMEHYLTEDKKLLFIHGDKIPSDFPWCETIVMSNEHPAVSLREGVRVETYKCFLKGTWKGKELIVLPSFNVVTEGTDVIKEKLLSPYLHQNLDNFEVFVVDDTVYRFGTLKQIKELGK